MTTVNPPAEFGHAGGGIASFTLRSGTNQIHGSVYEYFRNNALDARGFFSPTTPTLRQNEFGLTVGGPIRKEKTFFFGWYNGFRLNRGSQTPFVSIPTAASKQGNFSEYLGPQLPDPDAFGSPCVSGGHLRPCHHPHCKGRTGGSCHGLDRHRRCDDSGSVPRQHHSIEPVRSRGEEYSAFIPGTNRTRHHQELLFSRRRYKPGHPVGSKNRSRSLQPITSVNGSLVWSTLNTRTSRHFRVHFPPQFPISRVTRIFRLSDVAILRPNLINHATFGFNRWNGWN